MLPKSLEISLIDCYTVEMTHISYRAHYTLGQPGAHTEILHWLMDGWLANCIYLADCSSLADCSYLANCVAIWLTV